MFSEMVALLKRGEMIQTDHLQKRFDRALVKKIGVVNTPYHFWPSDPKINPPAKELLWAAILLQDKENYRLIEGIISTELDEKRKASGQSPGTGKTNSTLTEQHLREFLDLAPTDDFRNILEEKIKNTII